MDSPQNRLELDSRLSELNRVQPWIASLAHEYGFEEEALFAMQLCIEEALANVVLHGYRSEAGHPIVIEASVAAGILSFTIDDNAPPFSPVGALVQSDAANHDTLESIQPGGNGIRLLYRFAGSLAYERLCDRNRLTITFPLPLKDAPV